MSEVSWFWEDYEIRNSEEKNRERITHCETCKEVLKPTDLKSHRRCNACFLKNGERK